MPPRSVTAASPSAPATTRSFGSRMNSARAPNVPILQLVVGLASCAARRATISGVLLTRFSLFVTLCRGYEDIAQCVHRAGQSGLDHGGGVRLLQDRRAGDDGAGRQFQAR